MQKPVKRVFPAGKKAQAIAELEALVEGGQKPTEALEEVAQRTGMGRRSLWTYLSKTRGIAPEDREAALTRKREKPRPKIVWHPEMLKVAVDLYLKGQHVTVCHRAMVAAAEANGWCPVPSERTLRRELERQGHSSESWLAKRRAKPSGEV